MNVDELRRRLMTDPANEREAADAARAEGGEAARVAEEADAFERRLAEALNLAPPENLQQQLRQTPFRAGRGDRKPPGPAGWIALAASLALALAVTVFTLRDAPQPIDAGQDGRIESRLDRRVADHLAWHWDYDGPAVLEAARASPAEPERVQTLLGGFGVQLSTELLDDVQLSKICPTPDGAGAHLILATPDGPVTLYYMPRTRVPDSGESHPLARGMRAWVFNVEHGSVALVAERDRDLPALGQRIAAQLVFPDDRHL